ncbi:MAG: L-glutamate gamma-semialdehyde dehydrogenase [Pirellulaceae bacterium]
MREHSPPLDRSRAIPVEDPHADLELAEWDLAAIERTTQEVGRWIFDHLDAGRPSFFQREWWDNQVMDWAMRDEAVKVQMFRFVDVLPMLTSGDAVARHLREYLGSVQQHLPAVIRTGLAIAKPGTLAGRTMARAAKLHASGNARRFIAGTNAAEVVEAARLERKLKRAFTLDVLGEAVISEVEADRYLQAYIDLIENVAPTVNSWPEVPQVDRGMEDELPRMNVSIKLSALDSQFDPIDPEGSARRAGERLRKLLRVAKQQRAFVNVDMESYSLKDLTLRIFKQIFMEEEFRTCGDVGIVIQCYLRDAGRDLVALRDWAIARGKPVWVRLVKGAYWDYETTHAQATGWPVPVWQRKWESDANFERCTRFLMLNHAYLRPALGSHNIRSLAHGIAVARQLGLPPEAYEIQMLYGMADAEKRVLVEMGHRLRVYMPYGELIPGMAYLVRRLLENTSNDSFLKISGSQRGSIGRLLAKPGEQHRPATPEHSHPVTRKEPAMTQTSGGGFAATFTNEPPTDFALEENRAAMLSTLAEVKARFGRHYPLVIGGEEIGTEGKIVSVNPSRHAEVVGTVGSATAEQANQAVAAAKNALRGWAHTDVTKRAELLHRLADEMRKRKFELSAWIIYECGKPWRDADADVAEAIDFCDFYAQQAVALQGARGADVPGEENRFEYLPRGVTAVIAPWNFPLAILTGMSVAAVATGNTVVMKPAEQSSVVAAQLMAMCREVGFPPGVFNYSPGKGAEAGAPLVEHVDVAVISFTGSREVGLAINAKAAEVSARGASMVKRVIAEMGGKNAIIIDDDADLDEAVAGVMKSAFGFQGQKCSACSRAIVLSSAHDAFLERLVEATRSLHVGPTEDPASHVGPVIDEQARAKIQKYLELGRQEGREAIAVDVGTLADEGYFVGPHIFADVSPSAKIAQEEIFGPVLSVIRVANLDEALQVANATDYGLTGGVYSRSPGNVDRVRRELMVGNLYINRNITGALVGRQPFGGFKMSGIGNKAGGDDYLLQFVMPRTVTENTMRRGFAPPAEG